MPRRMMPAPRCPRRPGSEAFRPHGGQQHRVERRGDGRRAIIVADPSATRHTDTGHSSQPLAASAGASDSTYSGADAEEAVAGGGSGAAEASAAATAEEDKRVRALRMALQHKTQMPVTDEEARAILQARGGRETPVTEEEARVIFRARGDAGRGRATFQARARGRGGRATASPALASKGGEELSRRGKKAVAKEAGEVGARERKARRFIARRSSRCWRPPGGRRAPRRRWRARSSVRMFGRCAGQGSTAGGSRSGALTRRSTTKATTLSTRSSTGARGTGGIPPRGAALSSRRPP